MDYKERESLKDEWQEKALELETDLREARAEVERLRHEAEVDKSIIAGMDADITRLRAALERLANAADVFAADQSRATDPRCGRVQPITVAEGNELLAALRQANQIIERSEAAAPPLTDAELAGEIAGSEP